MTTFAGHSNQVDTVGPDDIIIPVMGITGSGKSKFISRCTGNDSGVGHALQSCNYVIPQESAVLILTHTQRLDTRVVSIGTFIHLGRKVRLIDTPGFDDSDLEDSEILNEIAVWLGMAYSQKPPLLLSGIIYLHPITSTRMRGTDKSNLSMFKALCGVGSLPCVVLATTMWNSCPEDIGIERQNQLTKEFWRSMVESGSTVFRHTDSSASAVGIVSYIMGLRQRIILDIQHQMVMEHRDVKDTDAGRELQRKLMAEREKAEERLRNLEAELQEALKANNQADAEDLFQRQESYHKKIEAKDQELERMKISMESLYKAKEEEFRREREEMERQRKRDEEKRAGMQKDLDDVLKRQQELAQMPGPPSYEVVQLNLRNEMLQHQLADLERQKANSRHKKMKSIANRSMKYGGVGAAAGVLAVTCTVM